MIFKPLRAPEPSLELVAAWRRDEPASNLQSIPEVFRELTLGQTVATPNGSPVAGA